METADQNPKQYKIWVTVVDGAAHQLALVKAAAARHGVELVIAIGLHSRARIPAEGIARPAPQGRPPHAGHPHGLRRPRLRGGGLQPGRRTGFVGSGHLVHYDPAPHTKTDLGIVWGTALYSSPSGDVSGALDADLYYDAQTFIKVWGWTTGHQRKRLAGPTVQRARHRGRINQERPSPPRNDLADGVATG